MHLPGSFTLLYGKMLQEVAGVFEQRYNFPARALYCARWPIKCKHYVIQARCIGGYSER